VSLVDSLFGSLNREVDDVTEGVREMNEKKEKESLALKTKMIQMEEKEASLMIENQELKDKISHDILLRRGSMNALQLQELLKMEAQILEVLVKVRKQIDSKLVDILKEEEKICIICMEEKKEVVLTSCGHYCVCFRCSLGISQCPVCRSDIQEKFRVVE
jgi:hypothetical protein